MNNKIQLVFKDGHAEDIIDCVRYTVPPDGIDIFHIITKTGDYVLSQVCRAEATLFADNNPLENFQIFNRYFKKVKPGLPNDRKNYKLVHDIKGIMSEGKICCEVDDE